MHQKWTELGKIPGQAASPRPAGLAPLHTVPRLRARGNVIHSSASESWIGCRFNRMDRKACTSIKGPTIQCKDMSKSAIHLPGIPQVYDCNVGATKGREEPEGGWPASPRPAGLARACVQSKQATPTSWSDHRRPGEGGGQMATSPCRPA